ncbi:MAG: thioesterase family protein [Solirubrobacteraceae bacterium]
MSAFEAATAVAPVGEGRWAATVSEDWFAVRGPNGGYLAAIVLRAMVAAVGNPTRPPRHPRSLTLHYTRPPVAGDLELAVTVERAGRRLSTVTARAEQGGKLCILATGAFSEDFGPGVEYSDQAPSVPHHEAIEPLTKEAAVVPIAQRFVIRRALGEEPFSEGDEALTGGWIAFRDGDPPLDACALAMLSDAWIPSPFVRTSSPFAAPTIDLTIHFRAPDVPAEWPVLARFSSRFAHAGFFEEDGELWSADGRLLAQSRQLGLMG